MVTQLVSPADKHPEARRAARDRRMRLRVGLTLGLAAMRSVRHLLDGDVVFPEDRLGQGLETTDGSTFVVYRETVLEPAVDASGDGVVLVFRMDVSDPAARGRLRDMLFDPVANVATPFFAGLPGFRRKLWLAGERSGAFLELYEWESAAAANRFVDLLQSLLAPVSHAGSTSFEVVDGDSIDAYVDGSAATWREDVPDGRPPARRTSVLARALALGLAVVAVYVIWSWVRNSVTDAVRSADD